MKTKKTKQQSDRYYCPKASCDLRFPSWQARGSHVLQDHPEPRKTIIEVKRFGDYHSLVGGKNIHLGDSITFTKQGIVTKISTTEHSDDVQIEVAVIKDFYSLDK
jgi:hypothetical protein